MNCRKTIFRLIIIFILLPAIGSSLSPSSEVVGADSSPSTSSFPSDYGGGVGSSSEENVDSFDVHPANRWTVASEGWANAVISDGVLNLTDVGDSTADYYRLSRDLRDLDGDVQVRFKFDVNDTSVDSTDMFGVQLRGSGTTQDIEMKVYSIEDSDYSATVLRFHDVDANVRTKYLAGTKKLYDNEWYRLRIDYDLLQSKCRFRIYFDNGSRLFDYDMLDVSTVYRPALFAESVVSLSFFTRIKTTDIKLSTYIDYVNAPFKERSWNNYDPPSDSDWITNSWDSSIVRDDVNDKSNWRLTVPNLDVITGVVTAGFDDPASMIEGDSATIDFMVHGVEQDTGVLDDLFYVTIGHVENSGDKIVVEVVLGGVTLCSDYVLGITQPMVKFSVSTREDRSEIVAQVRVWLDRTNETVYEDYYGAISVSDEISNPCQEFVLETVVICVFTGNIEWKSLIGDVDLITQNIFEAIGGFVEGIIGGVQGIAGGGIDFFQSLFKWLADIIGIAFEIVGDAIIVALGAVTVAVGSIEGWLVTLGETIGSIIADIEEWLGNIITNFIDGAAEFIEAIFDGLLLILTTIVDLVTRFVFFIWDAVGLPDILAIINAFLTSIIDVITGMPQILDDINTFLFPLFVVIVALYWFWLIFLSFAQEGFEPFSGLANMIERLLACYNLSIFGIGPIPIPIAIFFIPLTYFLIIPDTSVFAIW